MPAAIVYDHTNVYKVRNGNRPVSSNMAYRHLISADTLRDLVRGKKVLLLDCRFDLGDPDAGCRAYEEAHIPGALYADLEKDLSGPVTSDSGRHPLPSPDTAARRFGELGIDAGLDVVVYDQNSGAYAARAWWMLRWLGHASVRVLDGGLDRWMSCGYPVRGGAESVPPGRLIARPNNERILTTKELAAEFADIASRNLFDARDAERFRGESEPIDTVAGHVPGARSLPLTEFLNDDQTWKSVPELKQLWADRIDLDNAVDWAVMCGSGVTACHLALSGLEAGLPEPRLYVGSWSEWIRDPGRPIARGDAG